MANSLIIVPFILHWESGLSKRTDDAAAVNPCPFQYQGEYGWHTNKGITWTTWQSVFGGDGLSATRFFDMSDADWNTVHKRNYWDKCLLDQVKSQRIANVMDNWAYMSGIINPSKNLQDAIIASIVSNTGDGANIDWEAFNEDTDTGKLGVISSSTIASVNRADEETLYNDLIIDNAKYFKNAAIYLDKKYPGKNMGTENIKGWMNRLSALQDFNDNAFKIK